MRKQQKTNPCALKTDAGLLNMFRLPYEEAYPYVFAAAMVSNARRLSPTDRANMIRSFPKQAGFSDEEARSALAFAAESCGIRLSESFLRRLRQNADLYREKTDLWMSAGLWVFGERGTSGKGDNQRDESLVLFAFGEPPRNNARRVAVLNSRKPGRITPEERWPKVTGYLARGACKERCDLVSSYGNVPYDLVSYMGKKLGAHVWVVCSDGNPFRLAEGSLLENEFPGRGAIFNAEKTTFVCPLPPGSQRFRRETAVLRDRCVGGLAQEIRIAEIRAGGNMETMGRRALEQGKPMCIFVPERFDASTRGNRNLLETESDGNVRRIEWRGDLEARKSNRAGSAVKARMSRPAELVLVHYTRRCQGPWPGQSLEDYLEEVLGGAEDIEHTAFQTLSRILEEERIRAGHRLIRGSVDTVSFTECEPEEIRRLMRWHSAIVRWSFEPYGIVLPRAVLEEMGAVPAVYGDNQTYKELDESQKFRFQYVNPDRTDWSREKEWRVKGDLDLSAVPKESMRVIVPSDEEAAVIWEEFGIERWGERA